MAFRTRSAPPVLILSAIGLACWRTRWLAPETIELWPIERLRPYAQNAKTHGSDQVARIAASIAEFGWTVPVLVADDGEVIAGHGRILAAAELGLAQAPVIVLGHLTEAQQRAYRIADNKLTEMGGWDEAVLSAELKELLADEFDLALTGIEDGELDRLLCEAEAEGGGGACFGGGAPTVVVPEPVQNHTQRHRGAVRGASQLISGESSRTRADIARVLGSDLKTLRKRAADGQIGAAPLSVPGGRILKIFARAGKMREQRVRVEWHFSGVSGRR